MGARGTYDEFPKQFRATQSELDVIRILPTLRSKLDLLSEVVHGYWMANKDDRDLLDASAALTLAGASIQRLPVVVGGFVLQRTRPYFTARLLIQQPLVDRLVTVRDTDLSALLTEAIALDSRIRDRLGSAYYAASAQQTM